MLKILISGCNGHMGRVVESLCQAAEDISVVGGFDVLGNTERSFPVYQVPTQFSGVADGVIDFSSPAALDGLLALAKTQHIPLVLATTGYTPEQYQQIQETANQVPIFCSSNMSLGINVLLSLVKKAASVLGSVCDIEIVERHHRRKVDAPSGTALMIAEAAASSCGHPTQYVFDRSQVRQPRGREEIGISALRGGTIVGEHQIIFAGHDEIMEIKHTALSREIFAQGALEAARFLAQVTQPGLYHMGHLVSDEAQPS